MKVSCSILAAALATIVPLVRGQVCDPAFTSQITEDYLSSTDLLFDFGQLPPAVSDVTITASFQANLDGSDEYATVEFLPYENLPLFRLGDGPGTSYPDDSRPRCRRDEKTTTISATKFNELIVSQEQLQARILMDPSGAVDGVCNQDEGTVEISYTRHCQCETDVEVEVTRNFSQDGQDLFFDFGTLPQAISDVTIEAVFSGDINQLNEIVTVQLRSGTDTDLFQLGVDYLGSEDCSTDSGATSISASRFNSLAAIGPTTQFGMRMTTTSAVSELRCLEDKGTIKLTYQRHCPCNPVVIEDVRVDLTTSGQDMVFAFGDLPQAVSDVQIYGSILADLDNTNEFAVVQIPPSTNLFTLGAGSSDSNCGVRSDSTSLTAEEFNSLMASQTNSEVVVQINTSDEVDPGQYPDFVFTEKITVNFDNDGEDLFFNFGILPPAISDVTFTASFQADLDSDNEFASVKFIESPVELFSLGNNGGVPYVGGSSECRVDSARVTVSATDFNSYIADHPSAQIQVSMDATSSVSAFCRDDKGTVKLSYNICSDSSANADPH
ncbi:MAG: hypothetical protein SGBAC_009479, partial [Bacillariaceae sp.]